MSLFGVFAVLVLCQSAMGFECIETYVLDDTFFRDHKQLTIFALEWDGSMTSMIIRNYKTNFRGQPRSCKYFPGTCPKDNYQRLFVFNASYAEWIYKDKDAVILDSYIINDNGEVKSQVIDSKLHSVLGDGPPLDWVLYLTYDKIEDAYYLPDKIFYGGYTNACGMHSRDKNKYRDDYILNGNCLEKKICNAIDIKDTRCSYDFVTEKSNSFYMPKNIHFEGYEIQDVIACNYFYRGTGHDEDGYRKLVVTGHKLLTQESNVTCFHFPSTNTIMYWPQIQLWNVYWMKSYCGDIFQETFTVTSTSTEGSTESSSTSTTTIPTTTTTSTTTIPTTTTTSTTTIPTTTTTSTTTIPTTTTTSTTTIPTTTTTSTTTIPTTTTISTTTISTTTTTSTTTIPTTTATSTDMIITDSVATRKTTRKKKKHRIKTKSKCLYPNSLLFVPVLFDFLLLFLAMFAVMFANSGRRIRSAWKYSNFNTSTSITH